MNEQNQFKLKMSLVMRLYMTFYLLLIVMRLIRVILYIQIIV